MAILKIIRMLVVQYPNEIDLIQNYAHEVPRFFLDTNKAMSNISAHLKILERRFRLF